MAPEPVREQLRTIELRRLLDTLEPGRVDIGSPDAADAHVAVEEYLRRIIERALRLVSEGQRLAAALSAQRHLRSARVLCRDDGTPLTRPLVRRR